MKHLFTLLVALVSLQWVLAQPVNGSSGNPVQNYQSAELAPLIFTNGMGSVVPIYDLARNSRVALYWYAIPDRRHPFLGWQVVNVFTDTEITIDASGQLHQTRSVVSSPVLGIYRSLLLKYSVQPEEVLYDVPGVETLTEGSGWQANFGP